MDIGTNQSLQWIISSGKPAIACKGSGCDDDPDLTGRGASTRQLMETLGHDDISHAELYSREAEQARLARDGMAKLSKLVIAEKNKDAVANRN